MRNPWRRGGADDNSRRERASEHAETASASPFGIPDDGDETERIDPADLMAIRADDELLDALASGRSGGVFLQDAPSERSWHSPPSDFGGYSDDQAIFAMLQSWRDDVGAEPIPELITLDEAAAAINSSRRPRRRLVPVAAAAAVAVFALTGVGVAAGNATPDSPLWGLATMLNSQRAHSVQASYNADIALVAAQKALEQGDVAGAEAELARVEPQLAQVKDTERKRQLIARHANLADTAKLTPPGKSVRTDSLGAPVDRDSDPTYRNHHWHRGDSDSDQDESGSTTDHPSKPGHSTDPDRPSDNWPFPGQDPRVLQGDSSKPGDSTKPGESTKPGGPSDSSKPDGSTKPGGPSDSSKPGESTKPGGPSDSSKPGESTKPGGPSDSSKPGGSTKPGGPSDSTKPGGSTQKPGGAESGNGGSGGTHSKPSEPSHEKPTSNNPGDGGSQQGDGSGPDDQGDSSGDTGKDNGGGHDKRDGDKKNDDRKSDDKKSDGDRHGGSHDGGGDRNKGGGGGHHGGGHSEGTPDPVPAAGPAADHSLSHAGRAAGPVL